MAREIPNRAEGRIDVIDAFRGFALAGIVVAHMVEQFIGARPPDELAQSISRGTIDQVVQGLMQMLIVGKFFALFSFLFGLSFFLQMDRAAAKEVDFRGRFVWRLTILLVIGYVHSLFYRGDILTIYAPLGLLLVLFYKVRSDVILALSGILIAGAGRYIVFALHGDGTILPYGDAAPELPANAAYFMALQSGSLMDVFSSNAIYGHLVKMEFQIGIFGRWYLTFAFFLLGLWVGRARIFLRLDELRETLRKTLRLAIAVAVASLMFAGLLFSRSTVDGDVPQFDRWLTMFAFTAYDLFNVSLSAVYFCSFMLIFKRPAGQRVLGALAPYGRTALSNYVMQTVIGTFIFYHWGLGLLGWLSASQALLVAFSIVAFQVALSAWWLRRYRYGPLEWLWRSGTYLDWQPLRR